MPFPDLEVLFTVPHVDRYGGFDISPDGEYAAFSWNVTGQWEIYEAPLRRDGKPRQVTDGPGGKSAPRYAPDGARLAYALDLDGSESFDVCVLDRARRQAVNVTQELEGALQPNVSWSPDGEQLAVISQQSGRFNTYVIPSEGGPERLVLDLPHPDWDVRWSPDGSHLAVCAETTAQDYGIFVVPVEDAEPIQVETAGGPINAQGPAWSPDGNRLAFSSDVHGTYDLGIFDLEREAVTWRTRSEGDDLAPHWDPRMDRLTFVRRKRTTTSLAISQEGSVKTFRVAEGIHHLPQFTPDGQHVIFVFDNPAHPPDLWELSLDDGEKRPLTHSLPVELRGGGFAIPREVHYPGMDEVDVPGLLFLPEELDAPAPAVIVVHGGPNWLAQVTWAPAIQAFVSRGWVVLAPNYRGSIGYGRAWQLANRFDLGGVDTRDVAAGATYLVAEGLADPDRIALTGASHGGYLTMTCLTQYPDRWAAGSAVVPFLNWFTSHENARRDLQHWDIENMGDPEENRELWHQRSPFFFLDQVEAPVQLICGGNDPRCPASESIQARDALAAQGKPVELHLYPDEGHQFLKMENQLDAEKRRVDFLARALEG